MGGTLSLSLLFACSGAGNICQLIKQTWLVRQAYGHNRNSDGTFSTKDMFANVKLSGITLGGSPIDIQTPFSVTGDFTFDLPLDTNYDTLVVRISGDTSLLQIPADAGVFISANWVITQLYQCNTFAQPIKTFPILSANTTPDNGQCIVGGTVRSIGLLSPGGAVGPPGISGVPGNGYIVLFGSTPLGACNGITLAGTTFEPQPIKTTIAIQDGTCLCGSGGVMPYTYSIIEGNLPSGMGFDSKTGCMFGKPDGNFPGSASVTFGVTDALNDTAQITCNIIFNPCGSSPSGVTNYMY